ncbi:MAG: hypothetical protein NC180_10960 [Muribaculaceae bacterium]|nr:guanylate kinase [Roseburia sp.]MCM1432014.1 hypothetical protein [Muribaculaceae bacterium]MCM1493732.1 hypothetical protein [Muribaculaceae bacterium]
MGIIYCMMGKSSSGKDSVYRELMQDGSLPLRRIVPYTTRPMREGETPGLEYIFCDEARVQQLEEERRIIELRAYQTVHGIWKYFTVDDGQIEPEKYSYLYIVTLEGYKKIREYFGENRVAPIYIEVEDGERLLRAVRREMQQSAPRYEEMCRRFLADSGDFSGEKLAEAGIERRFVNRELAGTVSQVRAYIRELAGTQDGDKI